MGIKIWNTDISKMYVCVYETVNVSGVYLNENFLVLTTAWQTKQLTATITPSNADDQTVVWSTSDSTIATVDQTWLVTCVTPWSATITVTTNDGGYTATCEVGITRLPSAYQEVEWIGSSGSQYIDTGWFPTWTCEVETRFFLKAGSWNGIFWIDSWWLYRSCEIFRDRVFVYGSQTARPTSDVRYLLDDTDYVIKFDDYKVYVNGTLDYTFTSQSFTSSYQAAVFAKRRYSSIESYSSINLYYMKLWNNWVLERDFVPCYRIADGVIWMYDVVNGVFYTNQWSWTFTKWSDV